MTPSGGFPWQRGRVSFGIKTVPQGLRPPFPAGTAARLAAEVIGPLQAGRPA
jgi:hypothetical protein